MIGRGTCEATSFLPRAVHLGPFSRKITRARTTRIGLLTDTRSSFLRWKHQVKDYIFSTSTYGFSTLPATRSRHSPGRKECGRLDGHPTAASSPGCTPAPQEA